jgi:hypothetical protein
MSETGANKDRAGEEVVSSQNIDSFQAAAVLSQFIDEKVSGVSPRLQST